MTALPNSTRALPATTFMEAHYFQNDCFMRPGQILTEAGRLQGIPGIIVQGRYDLLCPPATSHALGARWQQAEIRLVEGAGHTLYDPGVRDAVMKAADKRLGLYKVSDFMTPDPVVLRSSDTLAVAIHKMAVGEFRHIPVVDGDRPIGVVAAADVFRHLVGALE